MSNTKKAKPKRLLSLFLALTMVLGLLPAMSLTAFAYSGSGTEGDPYIVTDYEELLELMKSTPDNTTRYIKLGSDISYSASTNGTALNLSNALQSVDLDLNGYTVSRSGTTTDAGVVQLLIGSLTIRDSSSAGTGKMTSSVSGGSGQATVYVSSGGKLTIETGTLKLPTAHIPMQYGHKAAPLKSTAVPSSTRRQAVLRPRSSGATSQWTEAPLSQTMVTRTRASDFTWATLRM